MCIRDRLQCYTADQHSTRNPLQAPRRAFHHSPPRLQPFPLVCGTATAFGEVLVSSAKLYVGNLSYDTSEASLRTLFAPHGDVVSVNLITDRDSGRAKGFGFVEMGTPEEAQKAVAALDGTQLDGRTLKVNEAKPQ